MNIFDQTGVNEQGLRPTLRKPESSADRGSAQPATRKRSMMMPLQPTEEKKVDFAFDWDKMIEDTFFNKLHSTVRRINDYHEHIGSNREPRRQKLQGVVNMEQVKISTLKTHFKQLDLRAERQAAEEEEYRKREQKEAKTNLGRVKKLIQKFSSLSISENFIIEPNGLITPRCRSRQNRVRVGTPSRQERHPRISRAQSFSRNTFWDRRQTNNSQAREGLGDVYKEMALIDNKPSISHSQSKRNIQKKGSQDNLIPVESHLQHAVFPRRNSANTLGQHYVSCMAQKSSEKTSKELLSHVKLRHRINQKDVVPEDQLEEVVSPIKVRDPNRHKEENNFFSEVQLRCSNTSNGTDPSVCQTESKDVASKRGIETQKETFEGNGDLCTDQIASLNVQINPVVLSEADLAENDSDPNQVSYPSGGDTKHQSVVTNQNSEQEAAPAAKALTSKFVKVPARLDSNAKAASMTVPSNLLPNQKIIKKTQRSRGAAGRNAKIIQTISSLQEAQDQQSPNRDIEEAKQIRKLSPMTPTEDSIAHQHHSGGETQEDPQHSSLAFPDVRSPCTSEVPACEFPLDGNESAPISPQSLVITGQEQSSGFNHSRNMSPISPQRPQHKGKKAVPTQIDNEKMVMTTRPQYQITSKGIKSRRHLNQVQAWQKSAVFSIDSVLLNSRPRAKKSTPGKIRPHPILYEIVQQANASPALKAKSKLVSAYKIDKAHIPPPKRRRIKGQRTASNSNGPLHTQKSVSSSLSQKSMKASKQHLTHSSVGQRQIPFVLAQIGSEEEQGKQITMRIDRLAQSYVAKRNKTKVLSRIQMRQGKSSPSMEFIQTEPAMAIEQQTQQLQHLQQQAASLAKRKRKNIKRRFQRNSLSLTKAVTVEQQQAQQDSAIFVENDREEAVMKQYFSPTPLSHKLKKQIQFGSRNNSKMVMTAQSSRSRQQAVVQYERDHLQLVHMPPDVDPLSESSTNRFSTGRFGTKHHETQAKFARQLVYLGSQRPVLSNAYDKKSTNLHDGLRLPKIDKNSQSTTNQRAKYQAYLHPPNYPQEVQALSGHSTSKFIKTKKAHAQHAKNKQTSPN